MESATMPSPAARSSATRLTAAVVALVILSAATLYIWASVLSALVTSGESVGLIVSTALLILGPSTAGCLFLVTKMATRHDLGLAYRLAWICLPVLALGLWVFICS